MKKQAVILQGAFVALLSFLMLQSVLSCGGPRDQRTPGEKGRELFVSYCMICHGENGKPGPMADHLKVEPPDLTLISQRRGGAFPDEIIAKIIDGREPVAGHGTLDMPAWGDTFMESEGLKHKRDVKETVDNLVAYLKLIQK